MQFLMIGWTYYIIIENINNADDNNFFRNHK